MFRAILAAALLAASPCLGATSPQVNQPARLTDMAAPTLLIPPSSVGMDLCLGEASGAYGSAMLAITVSTPQRDRVCSLLRQSKWADDLHEPELAREIMCGSGDWRAAAARVGRPCHADAVTPRRPWWRPW